MTSTFKTTLQRILSAGIGLPIYAYALLSSSFQSIPVLVASLFVSLATLYEFYNVTTHEEGGKPFVKTGLFFAFLINIAMYLLAFGKIYGYGKFINGQEISIIMAIFIFALVSFLVIQIFTRPIKAGTYSIAITLFGLIYISFFFSHIILIKALKNGVYYIFFLNFVVMLNDATAYFGGVLFGKHKTNFPVSPNKSWEGYFSGVFFSIIGAIILNQVIVSFYQVTLFSLPEAGIVGFVFGILGSVGDLVESAMKRDSSIKDSGSIIPGHGGMWDVFDAMIFTIPIFYYYLILKGIS